jgi:hypothetical protein
MLDRDGATFDPAELTQSPRKSGIPSTPTRSVRGQEPNGRELAGLLPARRERPSQRSAAERGYESPSSDADCHLPVPKGSSPCNVEKDITTRSAGL